MSTVNNGPQIVKTSLAFVLDPSVSAGYIKTPRQISNCIAWFDADDLSTITTEASTRNVRYWADKSNSNLVLTGGGLTLTNEPLSVIGGLNGRNTVRCDGGDYLSCAFTTTYTEFTIFYVFKGNESNNSRSHILSVNNAGANSGNFEFNLNDNYGSAYQTMWVYWNGGGSPSSVIGLTSPNTKSDFLQGSPTLFTFSHTNAGSGTNTIYVNGRTRSDQLNSSTQTITLGGAGNSLFLGARVASGLYYTGDICEVIIYSRQLSATERSQVQNYLSNKWRIPLLQATLTNRDLVFGKVATCQNNNIPVVDKSYRLNPANATGSPLQSNFYFADSVSWMSSVITNTITLEAWVKPNSFTFYGSPGNDLGTIMIANSNFYLSIDGNGKFNFYLVGSITSTVSHLPSTTSVTRYAWNHVAITYDGAYVRWYLNGVLDKISSSTYTLGTITLTNNLGIGSEGAATFGRNLDGYVAGCKIYGKALSASEISQNYESSKTEFSTLPNMISNNVRCYYDADIYSSYIGSGTSLIDLSGGGYTATINNAPTFVSPEPKAFILNGSTQDITLPSNFNNGITSGTWEFWVNCASLPATSGGIQQLYIQEACVWLAIYNISGVIFFGSDLNNGSGWFDGNGGWNTGARTTSTLSANTWYHVTYSWDGSTIRIYLNGNLESTTSTGSVNILGAGSTPRSIGSRSGSYFNGKFSMFRNYNISLTTNQVLQNYNATKFKFGK
jgi:hypothetical protein